MAYNLILYFNTKYINIQQYYIWNKVLARKIKLLYIFIAKIIVDKLTKPIMYIKFHDFLE